MNEAYTQLPFDELRTLHREIGALLAQRKHEALEQLREQAAMLGFTADDLAPKKGRGNGKHKAVKYRDPDHPESTYSGKGPKPQWLKDALDQGRQLEEFAAT